MDAVGQGVYISVGLDMGPILASSSSDEGGSQSRLNQLGIPAVTNNARCYYDQLTIAKLESCCMCL